MAQVDNLISIITSGARTNKYRILIPGTNSRDLSIVCTSTSLPGRVITPVDVVIKGKKAQLAGETQLEGSWGASFYNDSAMSSRIYFTDWMRTIHDLKTPATETDTLTNILGLLNSGLSRNVIANEYVKQTLNSFNKDYMQNINIQQLDHDNNVVYEIQLVGAFPINIDQNDFNSQTGEVSQTNVTFAYSDINYL